MNTPRHYGFDKRANILVFDSSETKAARKTWLPFERANTKTLLPFSTKGDIRKATAIATESHRLILEITFPSLITNRTIQGMVYQEKFHNTFAGFAS